MNKRARRKIEMGDRVIEIGTNPELAPTPLITGIVTQLTTVVTTLKASGTEQTSGLGVFRGGALECRRLAGEVRTAMRDIAEVAKVLKPADLPGAREIFRMPKSGGAQALLAAARHFAESAEPHAALFTARSLPATFVDDLEALVATFETAINMRVGGLTDRTEGTSGMEFTGKTVLGIVQELRAIMRNHLKGKPALLEAFNNAARLERDARKTDGTTTPPPDGGSGSAPVSSGS